MLRTGALTTDFATRPLHMGMMFPSPADRCVMKRQPTARSSGWPRWKAGAGSTKRGGATGRQRKCKRPESASGAGHREAGATSSNPSLVETSAGESPDLSAARGGHRAPPSTGSAPHGVAQPSTQGAVRP